MKTKPTPTLLQRYKRWRKRREARLVARQRKTIKSLKASNNSLRAFLAEERKERSDERTKYRTFMHDLKDKLYTDFHIF